MIELLVVIAVIAVLMGILMPVLSMAREMGKTIKCQANLRSLTMAWYTYATDNDDKLCGAYNHKGSSNGGTESSAGDPWDYAWAPWDKNTNAVAPDLMNATQEQRKEGIRRGSLYPYTKDVATYHCPSDRTAAQNYRSYSIPDSPNGQWGTSGKMNKAPWLNMRNLSQVSQPATAYVFLEEQDPRGYNANSWVIMPEKDATSWADHVVVWHGRRT